MTRTPGGVRAALAPRAPAAAAFLGAFGLLVAYALPDGAYGVATRQIYAILLWSLLGLGFACGVLPRARPSRVMVAALALLTLYAAWTALSLTWTQSAERTSAELARSLGYLGLLGLLSAVLQRRTWRPALLGLGAGALTICALALASRLAPSLFPANPLLSAAGTNRLSYPFGYWNAVGAWAAMSGTLALAFSAHDPHRARRATTLALVPIAMATVYLTYSRASVAGAAVGAVLVLVLSRNRFTVFAHAIAIALAGAGVVLVIRAQPSIAHGTGTHGAGAVAGALVAAMVALGAVGWLTHAAGCDRARAAPWLRSLLVLVLAGALAFSAAAFGPRLARRAWDQFHRPVVTTTVDPAARLTQLSGNRYPLWRAALHAFEAHPWSGTGAGTFEFWWDRNGSNSEFVRNAHSLGLENLAELGLPGLLLIAAVVITALAALVRVRARVRRRVSAGAATAALAAVCVYVMQANVDWLWQSTAVTVLALALVAAAAARRSGSGWAPGLPLRAVVVAAALGAIAIEVPGLLGASAVARSQTAAREGQPAHALAWADAAVGAEPWAASAYDQRALVFEATGGFAAAERDLRRAIMLEPENFRHWLLLARVEAEQGQAAVAARAYERARALRPHSLLFTPAPG